MPSVYLGVRLLAGFSLKAAVGGCIALSSWPLVVVVERPVLPPPSGPSFCLRCKKTRLSMPPICIFKSSCSVTVQTIETVQ